MGRHPGRQELPAELPRRERVLACPPDELHCPRCGAPREVIGYQISEQLDVEPARYFVLVTKREKRACPRCPEAAVAVVETCKRLGLEVRAYLGDVLPRLAATSIQRVGELTPARWAASRGG